MTGMAWSDAGRDAATPTSCVERDAARSTATGKISPPSPDLPLQLHDVAGYDKLEVPSLGDLCGSMDGRRRPPFRHVRPTVGGVAG
jgi:hypothetical protein